MTRNQYAKLRGRSRAWVTKQLQRGMPAKAGGRQGKDYEIDAPAAIDWEVEQAKGSSSERESQRERLLRAQAEKVEMENALRCKEIVLVSVVDQFVQSMCVALVGQLEALPGRIANELAGLTRPAEIRAKLLDEVRGIRTVMADYLEKLADMAEPPEEIDDAAVAAPEAAV